ncbi:ribonuclease Z 1 [Podospora fimiseda]|uniref:ribonuclease Z n=1 Tax=Podospora fimiseda TaxID=252190 RepID=A0AAN7BN70_9PEZI|nr:ribonuclease Z 1 [Podospora fimiseda]
MNAIKKIRVAQLKAPSPANLLKIKDTRPIISHLSKSPTPREGSRVPHIGPEIKSLFQKLLVWLPKFQLFKTPDDQDRNLLRAALFSPGLANTKISTYPLPRANKSHHNPSMRSHVSIVSAPTADTPGSCLLLHFDARRYLFGHVSEGTQRLMTQRKLPIAKIEHIFLTGTVDWKTTGGLLGMILSLADVTAGQNTAFEEINQQRRKKGKAELTSSAIPALNIHGGKNLMHAIATARRFVFRRGLPLNINEIRSPQGGESPDPAAEREPDFQDEFIRVWNLPLSLGGSPCKKRKLDQDVVMDDGSNEEVDQRVREAVVREMFGSNWSLDTLREMSLKDVQLPCKVFVRDENGHIHPYETEIPKEIHHRPDVRVLVRTAWPATKLERLPMPRQTLDSMCYIVKNNTRRGKFNPVLATSFGVQKTDFKKLTAGESVTGKDGVVVTPEMVLEPPIEGSGFALVDIVHKDLVQSFLDRPEWSNAKIMKNIEAMYWVSTEQLNIETEPRLVEFMNQHSSIKHVMFGEHISPNVLALTCPAAQTIKLNRFDPDRFRLPMFNNEPSAKLDDALKAVSEIGKTGVALQLAPKVQFETANATPVMDTLQPLKELMTRSREIVDLADAARKQIADPAFLAQVQELQKDMPDLETEIIPLGTGSALPSKYRNVSANLIRVPGHGSYIIDCGENTLGQLRRVYGYEGADEVLRDLRAICISHLHADHHLGTASVLARWRKVNSPHKLAIAATSKFHDWLQEYSGVEFLGLENTVKVLLGGPRYVGNTAQVSLHLPSDPDQNSSEHKSEDFGLPIFEGVYVDHCQDALALVLTFPYSGLKIAYSGDCRPSYPFVQLAKGAHLLIHECTFEDELKGDAIAKKHSTLSEALAVGYEMKARRILLTHFSQRYPKLPALPTGEDGMVAVGAVRKEIRQKEKQKRFRNGKAVGKVPKELANIEEGLMDVVDTAVVFAFDGMRVKLGEFKQAEAFIPALRKLLTDEEKVEAGEEKEEAEVEEGEKKGKKEKKEKKKDKEKK